MNQTHKTRKKNVTRRHLKQELIAIRNRLRRETGTYSSRYSQWLNRGEAIKFLNRVLEDI